MIATSSISASVNAPPVFARSFAAQPSVIVSAASSIAGPREELVVHRRRVVRRERAAEPVARLGFVVGHQHHRAVDDLDVAPVLAGAFGADLHVLDHLRQRALRPQVEDHAVADLGSHLDHVGAQRRDVDRRRILHRILSVAVARHRFEIELGLLALQHRPHHDRGFFDAGNGFVEGQAVPAAHHRLARRTETHHEPTRQQLADRIRGRGEHGGRARVHRRDRNTESQRLHVLRERGRGRSAHPARRRRRTTRPCSRSLRPI